MTTITATDFTAWLASKPQRGTRRAYYRGFLAKDRAGAGSVNASLVQLAAAVWSAYTAGLVTLTQQRHGPSDYSYFVDAL